MTDETESAEAILERLKEMSSWRSQIEHLEERDAAIAAKARAEALREAFDACNRTAINQPYGPCLACADAIAELPGFPKKT